MNLTASANRDADQSPTGALPARDLSPGISLGVANLREVNIRSRASSELPPEFFDRRIHAVYHAEGFESRPRTQQEAAERGVKGFNGRETVCTALEVASGPGGDTVTIDVAPARYLVGEAFRKLTASGALSAEEQQALHPKFLNVSALAIVRSEGKYNLLAQIKGKALGEAQLHPALVAGGVQADFLNEPDPLRAALLARTKAETGLSKEQLSTSPWIAMVNEQSLGFVNFVSCALQPDWSRIGAQFEAAMTAQLQAGKKIGDLDAKGMSRLPIEGLALVPLENKQAGFPQAECFVMTEHGLERTVETRAARPMFAPISELLGDKARLHKVLEASGW